MKNAEGRSWRSKSSGRADLPPGNRAPHDAELTCLEPVERSEEDLSTRAVIALAVGAAIYVAFLWYQTLGLPFFSDSFSHLDMTSRFGGMLDIFDLDLIPLRPLQHAWFYILQGIEGVHPGLARLPLFAMHLLACPLLWLLMREFGCSRRSCAIGVAAFLAFPSAKSLLWVAAVGWPGRLVATLLTCWLFLRHDRRPSKITGLGLVLSFVIALGFHQSAVMLPAWLILLVAMQEDFSLKPTLERSLRLMRDPWFLSVLLLATSFAVYVAFLREARYHHVMIQSIPANGARALFCIAPEFIRHPCVEGLRGQSGLWGYALGGGASLLMGGGLLLLLWRGSEVVRFLVLAMAMELSFPVMITGFSHRYAYVSAALMAVLLAIWWQSRQGGNWRLALVIALCCAWTYDQFTDLAEIRAAGAQSERLLGQLVEAGRQGGRNSAVVVINAPYVAGAERDFPVFNYGMRHALQRRGGSNPWVLVNTAKLSFGTDFKTVTQEELDRLVGDHVGPVLRYDSQTESYQRIR
jgi:hypothetical protein